MVESLADRKNRPVSCAALLVFWKLREDGDTVTGAVVPVMGVTMGVTVTEPMLGASPRVYWKT